MIEDNLSKVPPFPIVTTRRTIIKSNDPEKNRNRFGRMVYGHKTAGEICVMKRDEFEAFKSYEPQKGWSSIKTRSKTTSGSSGSLSGI